jgi:hypothetical protein
LEESQVAECWRSVYGGVQQCAVAAVKSAGLGEILPAQDPELGPFRQSSSAESRGRLNMISSWRMDEITGVKTATWTLEVP